MNREAQSVVLFLLGGAILRISATDVYLRYVKAGLRPFLIVSGVLLIVIAAVTLYREVFAPARPLGEKDGGSSTGAHAPAPGHAPAHAQAGHAAAHAAPHPGAHAAVTGDEEVPAPPGAAGNDGDGHAHGHAGPRVAWLLVVPVFAIFLIGPPALGSFAASRGGTSVAKQSDYAPLPAGDPVTLPVLDYASRAVWDRGASLTDRRVRLTGFVSPRPGGGVYLTRMILTCCAADGRPVKVGLSGTVPAGLPADTWIEVTGRYDPRVDKDRANNESIPYLAAEALREVTQPTQPYEQ
ncbi:MAG TPA: TIGR03943 family protein [Mycobacteriales bacterium]|nr:TIGR03943 family protein [Mycobacteriales bacterium]